MPQFANCLARPVMESRLAASAHKVTVAREPPFGQAIRIGGMSASATEPHRHLFVAPVATAPVRSKEES